MENQHFLHKKTRREFEQNLSKLSITKRAEFLAANHKKSIAIAQKHKIKIYNLKNKEDCYEQKIST